MGDWPQQLSKPHVYGNFKSRGPKARRRNSERFKSRPGMSEDHLALIRQLPCCVCSRQSPSDPHHLKSHTGERGVRSEEHTSELQSRQYLV